MKNIALLLSLLIIQVGLFAQINSSGTEESGGSITTAASFLTIEPNARGLGMGWGGVASGKQESAFSQNPALCSGFTEGLPDSTSIVKAKISFSPWLRKLIDGINMYDASVVFQNRAGAIGFHANLLDMGKYEVVDLMGNLLRVEHPREYCIGVTGAMPLRGNLISGVGLKYIKSELTTPPNPEMGNSVAADIGVFHILPLSNTSGPKIWYMTSGLSIMNIGTKIKYSSRSEKQFIPTMLKLGTSINYDSHERFGLTFTYQAEKLLVPTPPVYELDSATMEFHIIEGQDPNVSVFRGMIRSFSDAPGGSREEWNEVNHIFGAELKMNITMMMKIYFRAGYYLEHATKGNRKLKTFGAGFSYGNFSLDFSRLSFNNLKISSFGETPYSWNLSMSYLFQ